MKIITYNTIRNYSDVILKHADTQYSLIQFILDTNNVGKEFKL